MAEGCVGLTLLEPACSCFVVVLQQQHLRSFKLRTLLWVFIFPSLSLHVCSSMATLGACSRAAPTRRMMRKQTPFTQLWTRGWMNGGRSAGRWVPAPARCQLVWALESSSTSSLSQFRFCPCLLSVCSEAFAVLLCCTVEAWTLRLQVLWVTGVLHNWLRADVDELLINVLCSSLR